MLSFDAPLTFGEFMTREELPLATVFREVMEFLAGRNDAVVFGAYAVNAYCETQRMTQHIDVLSTGAAALAESLREHLAARFHIAVRVRGIAEERGQRIYQVRQPKNRHLVDVRQVDALPESHEMQGVRVITPVMLIAMKVVGFAARKNRPKGDTDRADLRRLLLAFPALKVEAGEVADRLRAMGASDSAVAAWRDLATSTIEPDDDDEY